MAVNAVRTLKNKHLRRIPAAKLCLFPSNSNHCSLLHQAGYAPALLRHHACTLPVSSCAPLHQHDSGPFLPEHPTLVAKCENRNAVTSKFRPSEALRNGNRGYFHPVASLLRTGAAQKMGREDPAPCLTRFRSARASGAPYVDLGRESAAGLRPVL